MSLLLAAAARMIAVQATLGAPPAWVRAAQGERLGQQAGADPAPRSGAT